MMPFSVDRLNCTINISIFEAFFSKKKKKNYILESIFLVSILEAIAFIPGYLHVP